MANPASKMDFWFLREHADMTEIVDLEIPDTCSLIKTLNKQL